MTAGGRERKGKSVTGLDASVPHSGPLPWLVTPSHRCCKGWLMAPTCTLLGRIALGRGILTTLAGGLWKLMHQPLGGGSCWEPMMCCMEYMGCESYSRAFCGTRLRWDLRGLPSSATLFWFPHSFPWEHSLNKLLARESASLVLPLGNPTYDRNSSLQNFLCPPASQDQSSSSPESFLISFESPGPFRRGSRVGSKGPHFRLHWPADGHARVEDRPKTNFKVFQEFRFLATSLSNTQLTVTSRIEKPCSLQCT